MAVYRVRFKMPRGVEDGEIVSCEQHAFDQKIELSDGEADQVWELLHEAGIQNTVGEYYEIDNPEPAGSVADAAGFAVIQDAFARLAGLCRHA